MTLTQGRVSAAAAATPIGVGNLTSIGNVRTFLGINNPGYLTYVKPSSNTILYKPNGDNGNAWKFLTGSSIAVTQNNTEEGQQASCVEIISNNTYMFNVKFHSNVGTCGDAGSTTNPSKGRINVNPPDDVPVAIWITDIDGTVVNRQKISFSSGPTKAVYTPVTSPSYTYTSPSFVNSGTGGDGTQAPGQCSNDANGNCNALILLYGTDFNVSFIMKSNNGVINIANNIAQYYQTLILDTNGGSVDDSADSGVIMSHKDGANLKREYVRGTNSGNYPNPTRTNYTFEGWYDSASGGTKYSSYSMWTDMTLYAHWKYNNVLSCSGGESFSSGGAMLTGDSRNVTVSATGTVEPPTKITGSVSGPLGFSQSINTNSSTSTFTFTPPRGGFYTLNWTATDGATSVDCSSTVLAGTQPYVSFSGGDVTAGTLGGDANIISWNSGSPDNYTRGANSSLSIIATGRIDGVRSGRDVSGGVIPRVLSFANNGADVYGGKFSKTAIPTASYDPKAGSGAVSVSGAFSLNALGDVKGATYKAANDITINASTISFGKKITIIADKNVYIGGNILYNYTKISEIPHFVIYAKNIIIGSGVTEIHGSLRAEETFYSCGSGPSSYVEYVDLKVAANSTACSAQLVVYGSASAGKLVLSRTFGSWADGGSAERFIEGPEDWLNGLGTDNLFSNYISLPPVL